MPKDKIEKPHSVVRITNQQDGSTTGWPIYGFDKTERIVKAIDKILFPCEAIHTKPTIKSKN